MVITVGSPTRIFVVLLSIGIHWTLHYLSRVLKLIDVLTENAFYFLSVWSSIRPCGVFERKKSAVVLIGCQSDLQTHVSLRLSELGYTVFMLCFEASQGCNQNTSPTASLVYEWHKQKDASWGMIIPIVVDSLSTERHRAAETIQAFCTKSSLHLTALLFMPPHSSQGPGVHGKDGSDGGLYISKTVLDSSKAQAYIWADVAAHSLKESVLFTQDYLEMLTAARGRVMFVASPFETSNSPQEQTTLLAHNYLKGQLQPLGVRVVLMAVDTMYGYKGPDPLTSSRSSHSKRTLQHIYQSLLPNVTHYLENSPPALIQSDISLTIHRVLCARYPQSYYASGIYSTLLGFKDNMKDLVILSLKSLTQAV